MSSVTTRQDALQLVFTLDSKEDVEAMRELCNYCYPVGELVHRSTDNAAIGKRIIELLSMAYDALKLAGS